ncbi:MAG: hypothetical protein ABL994_15585, partial [Verrucomicrobiales bacterium]
ILLVTFGIFLQLLSALSGLICWKRPKGWSESFSPILVPLLGPLSLTLAIYWNGWPWWLIPIAWMTDLGTLVLLWYLPAIIREEWKTSRFTCVLRLKGKVDNARAVLTFHTSGKYLLQKKWVLQKGQLGTLEMGEIGTYSETEGGFTLRSDEQVARSVVLEGRVFRIERRLARTSDGYLVEQETDLPESKSYHSLRNWSLRK